MRREPPFLNVSMARISQFECKNPELGSLFQSTAGQEGREWGFMCYLLVFQDDQKSWNENELGVFQ